VWCGNSTDGSSPLIFQVNFLSAIRVSYGNLAYINIFAPGQKPGKDKPLFVGSTVGFSGEVTLPVDGDYIVQVYQMKKSAQRNRAVSFNLDLQILDNKK
ncbi:hypothetical protein ABTG06_09030, partial [Acinetobacter baumannii]